MKYKMLESSPVAAPLPLVHNRDMTRSHSGVVPLSSGGGELPTCWLVMAGLNTPAGLPSGYILKYETNKLLIRKGFSVYEYS